MLLVWSGSSVGLEKGFFFIFNNFNWYIYTPIQVSHISDIVAIIDIKHTELH